MTTSSTIRLRLATPADIPTIQAIYAHHVLHGTATFEEEAPSVEEMERRFHHITTNGYPYIIAEYEGKVCGYAYLGAYRTRRAYRFTTENAIYVDKDYAGKGIGNALLKELIRLAENGPWRLIMAVITGDNIASIQLHKKHGFTLVGTEPGTGFKFGRWLDTVLLYKQLNGGNSTLPEG